MPKFKPKPHTFTIKVVLAFMREQCIGYTNAMTIDEIMRFCRLKITRQQFQHKVIIPLRESGKEFIGIASDGIFLCRHADDVMLTRRWYQKRIRSERNHLSLLKAFAAEKGIK